MIQHDMEGDIMILNEKIFEKCPVCRLHLGNQKVIVPSLDHPLALKKCHERCHDAVSEDFKTFKRIIGNDTLAFSIASDHWQSLK